MYKLLMKAAKCSPVLHNGVWLNERILKSTNGIYQLDDVLYTVGVYLHNYEGYYDTGKEGWTSEVLDDLVSQHLITILDGDLCRIKNYTMKKEK